MLKAEKQIRETICTHNLIEKGDHIVMGLSGGPDSVCLFHVLQKIAEEMQLIIHPVHINHRFRPGAAEEDQAYVEKLSQQYGLKAEVFTVDCNALAEELSMTSEEAGRKARYDAFLQVAEEIGGHVKIAVAHNANDQAETVLFRILRGTGMDGIAGMAYEREERRGAAGAGGSSFRIIRPLLDTWREDVEEYCSEMELHPVTDHTNNEELYARNKIRLDLIPYIEAKYNSNFQEGLVRMAKIAAADKDFFWTETAQAYERLKVPAAENLKVPAAAEAADSAGDAFAVVLDWRGLAECHEALRHRVILKAFRRISRQNVLRQPIKSYSGELAGKRLNSRMDIHFMLGKELLRYHEQD